MRPAGAGGMFTIGSNVDEQSADRALQLDKIQIDDATTGMQNDVHRRGQPRQRAANGGAHAALDPVAINGLAERLGNGEADPRARRRRLPIALPQQIKTGDLFAKPAASGLIDVLVVGVFGQAMRVGRDGHGDRLGFRKTGRSRAEERRWAVQKVCPDCVLGKASSESGEYSEVRQAQETRNSERSEAIQKIHAARDLRGLGGCS